MQSLAKVSPLVRRKFCRSALSTVVSSSLPRAARGWRDEITRLIARNSGILKIPFFCHPIRALPGFHLPETYNCLTVDHPEVSVLCIFGQKKLLLLLLITAKNAYDTTNEE